MPKFLENKLKAEAAAKGFKGKRADRYVYGAMNNMGAMQGNKETAKGAEMDRKHMADEIAKFKGEQKSYSHLRPEKRVVTRYDGKR